LASRARWLIAALNAAAAFSLVIRWAVGLPSAIAARITESVDTPIVTTVAGLVVSAGALTVWLFEWAKRPIDAERGRIAAALDGTGHRVSGDETFETAARELRAGLAGRWWSWPFHVATGFCAVAAIWTLYVRRYTAARFFAAAQVVMLVMGWALSHYPYIVVPDVTIQNTHASAHVLGWLLAALVVALACVLPAFWYLYRIFKRPEREG